MNPTVTFLQSQIGKTTEKSPSPVGAWLRGTLTEAEEGKIIVEYTIRPEMCNPAAMLHGGSIALICDEMIGIAVSSLHLPEFFTTININVDFLYGVKCGETVKAVSEIVRWGKNIINAECRVFDSAQRMLAKSSSNLIRTSSEKGGAKERF